MSTIFVKIKYNHTLPPLLHMDVYLTVKTLHIISSTILFGSGIGIAFFMYLSCFSDNLEVKYFAAKNTVLADYLFTLPAVIIQPLSGFWLINESGYNWDEPWLQLTYVIYIITAACWIPVLWMQIELKKILIICLNNKTELPIRYHKLFKSWFILGWPAFIGLLVIFYLMVTKSL